MLRYRVASNIFPVALLAGLIAWSIPHPSIAQTYSDQQGLLDRLDRLERDLSQVQGQVYRSDPSPVSSGPRITNENSGPLEVRLSELEEQMRNLTGRVEKAEFAASKVNERLDKVAADNDFRFGELEKKAAAAPEPSADTSESRPKAAVEGKATSSKSAATHDSNPSQKLGSISAKALEHAEEKTTTKDSVDEDSSKSVQDQYDDAFSLLRQSKFDEAEVALKKFIADNGKNPLTGNAFFWLGEAYYAQSAYDKAAVQFLKGYKQSTKGSKAPDSLLKLAISLGKLKKKKEACATFTKLANEFPDASSSVTEKAQEEAARLGCK